MALTISASEPGGGSEDAGVEVAARNFERSVDARVPGALAQALADVFAGDADLDVYRMSLNSPCRHEARQADKDGNETCAVLTPIAFRFEEHFYLSDPEVVLALTNVDFCKSRTT